MKIELISACLLLGLGLPAALRGGPAAAAPTAAAPAPAAEPGNRPPQCIGSAPEVVNCNGGLVTFVLDGSASFDPDDDPLSFEWSTGCPGAVIAEPNAEVTTMTVDTAQVCGTKCSIRLVVDDGQLPSFCRLFVCFQPLELKFDIKPGSCPNPINVGGGGPGEDEDAAGFAALPTSLIGSKAFDPMNVEQSSVTLTRADEGFLGGAVAPYSFQIADTATPYDGELCGCHELGGDGIPDLVMHFDKQEVIDVLGLAGEENMSFVQLRLNGVLIDGTLAFGDDCVRIQNPN